MNLRISGVCYMHTMLMIITNNSASSHHPCTHGFFILLFLFLPFLMTSGRAKNCHFAFGQFHGCRQQQSPLSQLQNLYRKKYYIFVIIGQLFANCHIIGVKVRNMKMDFNTGGTWSRVGQWTLMMKIYDFFFYSAKSLSSNK